MTHTFPMQPKMRYQRGTIRIRGGKVYGEWRGEPGTDGKRPHKSKLLGRVKAGKSRNDVGVARWSVVDGGWMRRSIE